MPTNTDEESTSLQARVGALEERLAVFTSEVTQALVQIAEALSDSGPLAVTLDQAAGALDGIRNALRTTDDALGDAATLRSLAASIDEIKKKLGVAR